MNFIYRISVKYKCFTCNKNYIILCATSDSRAIMFAIPELELFSSLGFIFGETQDIKIIFIAK